MIPIAPQPEPEDFDELVRKKGNRFLRQFVTSIPTTKQWNTHDYWNEIRIHIYKAYEGICAYSAHWIPITANPHIDHYVPKSINKSLAYEWSNYRLTCALANTFKKDYEDVVDPFTLKRDSFILDFPSLLVKSNPVLDKEELEKIHKTIIRLKLNDEKFIMDRSRWLSFYCEKMDFDFLKRNAPFIAYELERQNLVEKIKGIMSYNPEIWE